MARLSVGRSVEVMVTFLLFLLLSFSGVYADEDRIESQVKRELFPVTPDDVVNRRVLAAAAAIGEEVYVKDTSEYKSFGVDSMRTLCEQIDIFQKHPVDTALRLLLGSVDHFNDKVVEFLERIHTSDHMTEVFRAGQEHPKSGPMSEEEREKYVEFWIEAIQDKHKALDYTKPLNLRHIYEAWLVPEGLLGYDKLTYEQIEEFQKCATKDLVLSVEMGTRDHLSVLKSMLAPFHGYPQVEPKGTAYSYGNKLQWSHVFRVFDLFLQRCLGGECPTSLSALLTNDYSYRKLMDICGEKMSWKDNYDELWTSILTGYVAQECYEELLEDLIAHQKEDFRAVTIHTHTTIDDAFTYDFRVKHLPPFARNIVSKWVDEPRFPTLPLTVRWFEHYELPVKTGVKWSAQEIFNTLNTHRNLKLIKIRFSNPEDFDGWQAIYFPSIAWQRKAAYVAPAPTIPSQPFPDPFAPPGFLPEDPFAFAPPVEDPLHVEPEFIHPHLPMPEYVPDLLAYEPQLDYSVRHYAADTPVIELYNVHFPKEIVMPHSIDDIKAEGCRVTFHSRTDDYRLITLIREAPGSIVERTRLETDTDSVQQNVYWHVEQIPSWSPQPSEPLADWLPEIEPPRPEYKRHTVTFQFLKD